MIIILAVLIQHRIVAIHHYTQQHLTPHVATHHLALALALAIVALAIVAQTVPIGG